MAINKQSIGFPSLAKAADGTSIQWAFDWSKCASYYSASISSSTDPFAGKTNKYAESNLVRIAAAGNSIHFKWSAAGDACTTADPMINEYDHVLCAVDHDKPYLRVIQNAAGGKVSVQEFFADEQ